MTSLLLFDPRDVGQTAPRPTDDPGAGAEFFPTSEREILAALLRGMAEAGHEPLPLHGRVRESAAGSGHLIAHVEALLPSKSRRWDVCELRRERETGLCARLAELGVSATVSEGDFIAAAHAGAMARVDLDITNPAWSKILQHAEASLLCADVVALHGPLATLETPERARWLKAHMPDVYPLEWRPDYDGRGTMARPVAWFVFGKGRGGRWWPLTRET